MYQAEIYDAVEIRDFQQQNSRKSTGLGIQGFFFFLILQNQLKVCALIIIL